jgi:hypothetical protein
MAEPWLHDDTSIEVDVTSLKDFAARMDGELRQNFNPSMTEGLQPVMGAAPMFGGGGLKEGQFYGTIYSQRITELGMFLQDVVLGFQAMSAAAMSISAEYASGDALSAATVNDVFDIIYPSSNQENTLRKAIEKAQADAEAGEPGATDPTAHVPGQPGSGDAPPPTEDDEGGGRTLAEGKPGEFHIPADEENVDDAPEGPTMPESDEVILAPGPTNGSGDNGGTVA